MPSIDPGSLKNEAGIAKLNDFLANRSYIAAESGPSAEDMACFAAIASVPSKKALPNAARWYRHILAVRASHAPAYQWPAAGAKPKAAAKPKKAPMEVDVKPEKWSGVMHKPSSSPPALGLGDKCVDRKGGGLKGKYYITTAINYANGWPHMGHAYEAIVSDVFARHHRLMGEDTYYLTGSDEHGQKIAEKAEADGLSPIASCDRFVDGFKCLNQRLRISNNFYIRTTQAAHKAYVQELWKNVKAKGDIYFGDYEGWYCVREERYFTDTEALESDYKDPVSGVPLEKRKEASFFFRLSKYAKPVLDWMEANESFIQPQQFRGEIMDRLKGMEMRDLCISRGTFAWGVPCPEEPVNDQSHVMYVWFDALTNYASAVGAGDKANPLSRFWPADMHIVGKDINWFHSVYWPAMLMSAGMPLPKSIVVHGFIAGSDGRKMSKSLGNVVDAHDILDEISPDTFRWYICREAAYGDDLKFNMDGMKLMHNADLCGNFGNLVNRAISLCGGAVPEMGKDTAGLPFKLDELKAATSKAYLEYRLSEAADLAVGAANDTNKWLNDNAPWNLKDEKDKDVRATRCRVLLEAVYILAHFFGPFVPAAAEAVLKKIGQAPMAIPDLSDKFANLKTGAPATSSTILFEMFDMKTGAPSVADAKEAKDKAKLALKEASKESNPAPAKVVVKEKPKAAPVKEKAKAAPETSDDQPLFTKLDIRVGRVVDAWFHPEADRLFIESIDVGEAAPRQIVSGLREHYKLEEFKGRKLLVVCNMKPSKLVKVDSSGMVLCAKNADKVELLIVPDNLEVGTRVLPDGTPNTFEPFEPNAVKKKKVWEGVAELLRTDKNRVAMFDGKPLVGPGGEKFLAATCSDSPIS